MKSKTHGKPGKTFVPYKSAAAFLLLAALAAALAILPPGGGDTVHAFTPGERITDLEFAIPRDPGTPMDLASTSSYFYVVDRASLKVHAYRNSPANLSTHGNADSSLDITLHASKANVKQPGQRGNGDAPASQQESRKPNHPHTLPERRTPQPQRRPG